MEYELKAYDEDLIVIGPGMNAERYQAIKGTLPEEIQQRLIGWRLAHRLVPGYSTSLSTESQTTAMGPFCERITN